MTRIICCIFMTFAFIGQNKAQSTALLRFSADSACSIEISGNIDGAFQDLYALDQFQLKPKTPIQYNVSVNDCGFFRINFDNLRCFVLAFPGDTISINFANMTQLPEGNLPENWSDVLFTFKGANAFGHKYYNRHWNSTALFVYKLQEKALGTEDYSDFQSKIETEFIEPTRSDIMKMIQSGDITDEYGKVTIQDITVYQYFQLFRTMKSLYRNKELTTQQAAQTEDIANCLMDKFLMYNDLLNVKYRLGMCYISSKYDHKYDQLSDKQKENLCKEHDAEELGQMSCWLLAPEQVKLNALFSNMMVYYMYGDMGFDSINLPAILNYIKQIAPKSESLKILTKIENQRMAASAEKAQVKYMDGPINSFAELMNRPELKGNYCLIDLWATWCMPCLMEHKHAEALHKAVSDFKNLKQVYITIDEPKDEKRWKAMTEKFNLSGFHLMATPELQKEIQVKIFKGEDISIPRYILLSPSGEVINPELPRPSELGELKKVLTGSVGLVI